MGVGGFHGPRMVGALGQRRTDGGGLAACGGRGSCSRGGDGRPPPPLGGGGGGVVVERRGGGVGGGCGGGGDRARVGGPRCREFGGPGVVAALRTGKDRLFGWDPGSFHPAL